MCDIMFDQSACRVSHVSMLNEPKFIDIKSKHLRIFLGNLRKCSEKFGNCSESFVRPSDNILKIFGNLRKMVGNLRKIVKVVVSLVGLYNKQNNTWLLGDMKFIFSCSKQISHSFATLTRELSIWSWTLEDKFHISAQPCIILYIYLILF